jgi:predicted metallo-beta-lactamase superfamily hydrolase
MTTQTFLNNLESTQKELFANQKVLLKSFNNFLSDNQEFKTEFFNASQKEQESIFKYVVFEVIGKIAIKKTFN